MTDGLPTTGQQLQEQVNSVTNTVPSSVQQEVQGQVNESARQLTDALPTPDQVQRHAVVKNPYVASAKQDLVAILP